MNLNGMSALSDIVSISGFSISGDIIGVIIFLIIVCAVIFANKLPTSNKEMSWGQILTVMCVLFGVIYFVVNHN